MSVLASCSLFAAFGYLGFIHGMLIDYIDLVSRHLSQKERASRKRALRDMCLKDDPKLEEPVGFKLGCKRFYRFFCKRKVPKSNIK